MSLINFQTSLLACLDSLASVEFCLELFLPLPELRKMHVINFISNVRDRKAADNFRVLMIILLGEIKHVPRCHLKIIWAETRNMHYVN